MSNETIFRPRYEFRVAFSVPALIVAEGVLLSVMLLGHVYEMSLVYLNAFFGLLLLTVPFWYIRCIRFGTTEFVIERFILPPRSISYQDVYDLGRSGIKTRQGDIALNQITNAHELLTIFEELVSQRKISAHQLEGKLIVHEQLAWKASLLSLLMAIPATWIADALHVWPNWSWLNLGIRFGVVWVAIYCPVYWYMKYRAATGTGRQ
jgi:hypothetical protein